MSDTGSANVKLCQQWYNAFDQRKIEEVMALFTDDVVVLYGAGASSSAVGYGGTYVGAKEVRDYYDRRFAQNHSPLSVKRPLCAHAGPPMEYGDWVVFSGDITDATRDNVTTYQGKFLHVWRINTSQRKICSLEAFLEPSGRVLPPSTTSASATQATPSAS
jgi:hypothetical protein